MFSYCENFEYEICHHSTYIIIESLNILSYKRRMFRFVSYTFVTCTTLGIISPVFCDLCDVEKCEPFHRYGDIYMSTIFCKVSLWIKHPFTSRYIVNGSLSCGITWSFWMEFHQVLDITSYTQCFIWLQMDHTCFGIKSTRPFQFPTH